MKRNPQTMRDYEKLISSQGEVSIGAYARAQQRQRLALGLFGVGLLGFAIALYVMLAPKGDGPPAGGFSPLVECSQCHLRERRSPAGDERFPLICSKCAQKAVFPLMECRKCGKRFIWTTDSNPACPKCRSASIGSAQDDAAEKR